MSLHRLGYLAPVSVHEVAAGETVAGLKEIQFNSSVLEKLIQNRAYLDIATFYIPFRLLWDEFPTWLIDGTGTLPSVATANFEGVFLEKHAIGTSSTTLVPWIRMAYNKIWNTYFRPDDITAVDESTNGSLQLVYQRTNDFFTSEPEGTDSSFSIGSTVDSMRAAVAKDNFNKVRKYYGERYVDYLNAMGIEVPWTITEEPELIKKSSQVMFQNVTKSTDTGGASPVGTFGGSYAAKIAQRIPRKFFPEHGLILTVASWKMQKFFKDTMHPMVDHTNKEDFWSPEYDMDKEYDYPMRLWNDGHTGTDSVTLPNFEHLRKGMNLTFTASGSGDDDGFFLADDHVSISDIDEYKEGNYPPAAFPSVGTIPDGGSLTADSSISCITRMSKRSPVGTRAGSALR